MRDPFDPNTVPGMGVVPLEPCEIYGSDDLSIFAIVDGEDYQYLAQWKWSPKFSRGDKKFYLRRNAQVTHQKEFWCEHMGRVRNRTQRTLFLHQAVMALKGDAPPTPDHKVIDHIDGDSMNNRRSNLRWATVAENNTNRKAYKHGNSSRL